MSRPSRLIVQINGKENVRGYSYINNRVKGVKICYIVCVRKRIFHDKRSVITVIEKFKTATR